MEKIKEMVEKQLHKLQTYEVLVKLKNKCKIDYIHYKTKFKGEDVVFATDGNFIFQVPITTTTEEIINMLTVDDIESIKIL
jgi:hypothetical protein